MDQQTILKTIQEKTEKTVAFSQAIKVDGDKDKVNLELQAELICTTNMQEATVAFEAWAIILKSYFLNMDGKVNFIVDNPDIFKNYNLGESYRQGKDNNNPSHSGHFNRFLYRLMKFEKTYAWFTIGDTYLKKLVDDFESYMYKNGNSFSNNVPGKSTEKKEDEDIFEASEHAVENKLLINHKDFHNQLPVGLFEGKKYTDSDRIFTGGKSAIDLWRIKDDTILELYELKYLNKMVGIITELMFYTNFMADFLHLSDDEIVIKNMNLTNDKSYRGYDELYKARNNIQKINSYMLIDNNSHHPVLTKDLLDVINAPLTNVKYHIAKYNADFVFKITQDITVL
jgi:hypothetical protein